MKTEVIVGVVLALLVWLAYWLRMHALVRRLNLRFEERLAERTRIAQELHDTLLQGFLSASMQVDFAVDLLPDESESKAILVKALELMKQVIQEGRNTVRGLRCSHTVSLDLEQAFSKIQDEFATEPAGRGVKFRVETRGQPKPLLPLTRDEVYRIGREAVINAFRHAHSEHIDLEVSYASHSFNLMVRDDGCGIDPDIFRDGRDGHWGISGMRERANRAGGRLRIFTSPVAGTEVNLAIPSRLAFQAAQNSRFSWLRKETLRRTL